MECHLLFYQVIIIIIIIIIESQWHGKQTGHVVEPLLHDISHKAVRIEHKVLAVHVLRADDGHHRLHLRGQIQHVHLRVLQCCISGRARG